jgi:hypothetical protein
MARKSPLEHRTQPRTLSLLDELKRQAQTAEEQPPRSSGALASYKPTSIDEKIRKQKIENDNIVRDQRLKETTLKLLFTFLTAETIVIFTFAFLQGLNRGFHLDEWSFRVVLSATILQITAMLTIAVQHLFPKKR